ncbi:MAG: hypothetical protein AAF990_18915 [Bacteroidota bacterium]
MQVITSDVKLIFRDPTLRVFVLLLIALLTVVVVFLPSLVVTFPILEPLTLYILMGATVQASILFGFIYSMVLIDEKETAVAKVYGVLPVEKMSFLGLRLLPPVAFCILITFCLLEFQTFYKLSSLMSLLISFLIAFLTPLLILGVASFSKNKMEGMTWFKIFQLLVTLPLLAYLVPKYGRLFGVLPSYWGFEVLREVVEEGYWHLPFSIGLLHSVVLLYFLMKYFLSKHYR